tara:strand:- start:261 stop:494 length:234 start_codon:yes stop_codon:yes gene_type:complete
LNKNKKEYFLTLSKGMGGYFVCDMWVETNVDDEDFCEVELDRCKPTEMQYQFKTKYEAIKDFENWCGDNWDGVERRW